MAGFGRQRSNEPRFAGQATIVALALFLLGLLAVQSSPDVRKGLEATRARMDDVSTRPVAGDFGGGFSFSSKARKHHVESLENEVAALRHWRESVRVMAARMGEYERMLDLMGEPQLSGVTARVIAEYDGPFADSRIANAGEVHGVEKGFAAQNENGLVGRVIRVGSMTSRILLVTDYNSRIPVMGRASQDRALLVGDGKKGARLMYAETPGKIVEGEEWVTSGDDGIFDRGLTVGWAHGDKDGWTLDLALNRSPIDFVRLSPPPGFTSPENDPSGAGDVVLSPNTNEALISAIDPPTDSGGSAGGGL